MTGSRSWGLPTFAALNDRVKVSRSAYLCCFEWQGQGLQVCLQWQGQGLQVCLPLLPWMTGSRSWGLPTFAALNDRVKDSRSAYLCCFEWQGQGLQVCLQWQGSRTPGLPTFAALNDRVKDSRSAYNDRVKDSRSAYLCCLEWQGQGLQVCLTLLPWMTGSRTPGLPYFAALNDRVKDSRSVYLCCFEWQGQGLQVCLPLLPWMTGSRTPGLPPLGCHSMTCGYTNVCSIFTYQHQEFLSLAAIY